MNKQRVAEIAAERSGERVLKVRGPDHNGDYAVLTTGGAWIVYEDGTADRSAVSFTELILMEVSE